MAEIADRRADRLRVLQAIYDSSAGSVSTTVGGAQLLEDLGMSDQAVADACDWLEGEHLIQGIRTLWGHRTPYIAQITHRGIKEMEQDANDTSSKEVEKRRADRLRVFKAIYDLSVGSEATVVEGSQLLEDLGLSDQEVADACDWLEGEHFIKGMRLAWGHLTPTNVQITHRGIKEMEQGGDTAPVIAAQIGLEELTRFMQITHQGIEEIKRSLEAPRQATENFPAITNLFHLSVQGDVINSSIQGASPYAHQNVSAGDSALKDIYDILDQLKARMAELDLTRDTIEEITADIETIKAQAGSPRPKRPIIRESLRNIRRTLVAATVAGDAVASILLESLKVSLGGGQLPLI